MKDKDDDEDDDSEDDDTSSESNGHPIDFSSEGERDFYGSNHDQDVYEIEWQLDLVPKRVVPKDKEPA